MFSLLKHRVRFASDSTALYDQNTFYAALNRDLSLCRRELIIESPFITESRMNVLLPIFRKMCRQGISIIVNTRNPIEHDGDYYRQASEAVAVMQEMGITVLFTVGHHRKLVIIDQLISYEGSLNVLSYNDSCEIMRKIVSEPIAKQLCSFIGVNRYIKENNYERF